ncbi:hypothetical protein AMECASPLE_032350 [Ameca splendens]|uniref:Uncharacterized protein n=1 Tax=Ameca splendens TaxID=208324 RepID=A0ABV0Z5N0_9TELE
MSFGVFKQQAASISPLEYRDHLDIIQAGSPPYFVKAYFWSTFASQKPRHYCPTGLPCCLPPSASCLTPIPQNPSTLHRSQATQLWHCTTTRYCTLLVWKPLYSPHCVLFLVILNPSPPGGELTQPTYPSMYQSAQYSCIQ